MDKMTRKKKQAEYCVILNEYQCPGFVDKSCSSKNSPLLYKGWGERRCEVVRSDDS
jgi:hypothetical protein